MGGALCCQNQPGEGGTCAIVERLSVDGPLSRVSDSRILFSCAVPEDIEFLGIAPASLPPQSVFLRYVEEGSWAEQNGISMGDELLELNGLPVRMLSIMEFNDILKRERPLRMTFSKGRGFSSMIAPSEAEKKVLRKATTKELLEWQGANDEALLTEWKPVNLTDTEGVRLISRENCTEEDNGAEDSNVCSPGNHDDIRKCETNLVSASSGFISQDADEGCSTAASLPDKLDHKESARMLMLMKSNAPLGGA